MTKPPLWSDLARDLRERLYPVDPRQAPDDALRLAQEFEHVHSREGLRERIERLISDDSYRPRRGGLPVLRPAGTGSSSIMRELRLYVV